MNTKIKKYKYTFLSILILTTLSIVSCNTSPISGNNSEILKQNITIQDEDAIIIDGYGLTSDALNSPFKLNASDKKHIFKIHKIPLSTKGSSLYSELSLTLNGYNLSDLAKKNFFLVLSNTKKNTNSQSVRTNNTLAKSLNTLKNRAMPENTENRNYSLRNTLLQNSIESPYSDFDNAKEGTTTRSAIINKIDDNSKEKKIQVKLLKKIKHNYDDGKIIRVLFWVQKEHYTALNKIKAEETLTSFEKNIFTDEDALYKLFYAINGDNHFWDDEYKAEGAAKGNAPLHVVLGMLGGDHIGYIKIYQFFKRQSSNEEEKPTNEPTIYLNVFGPNVLRDYLTQSDDKKTFIFYKTFFHELQHISHLYNRNVLVFHEDDIEKQAQMGSVWYIELIATLTEQIMEYALLTKLEIDDSTILNRIVQSDLDVTQGFKKFNHTIFQYYLIPENKNMRQENYKLCQVFAKYLITNYGADILSNLMHNNNDSNIIDEEALFDAISNDAFTDTFYEKYKPEHRPKSFEELINDFYTAALLSEVPFAIDEEDIGTDYPPIKMYIYDNDKNLDASLSVHNNESNAIITIMPIKNDGIKTIFKNNNKFISYNLSTIPFSNVQRSNTYGTLARNDTENNIDFSEFWLSGAGPIFSTENTINQTRNSKISSDKLKQGLGAYLYLGGNYPSPNNNISFTNNNDTDATLSLNILIPSGTAATLVVTEEKND